MELGHYDLLSIILYLCQTLLFRLSVVFIEVPLVNEV